jgi:hypothetical protein
MFMMPTHEQSALCQLNAAARRHELHRVHAFNCRLILTGKWQLQERARNVLATTNSAEAEVESFAAKIESTDAFKKGEATVSANPNPGDLLEAGSAPDTIVRFPSQPLLKSRQFAANCLAHWR